MASNGDFNTALEVMRSANDDFLELINNLKAFLSGNGAITFNIGGQAITVNSLNDLIENYKKGKFKTILLGGQATGKQVMLSVDENGRLLVSDTKGTPVPVTCDKLSASTIDNCVATKVQADECEIRNIKNAVNIKGGSAKLHYLEVGQFVADSLDVPRVKTENLQVNGTLYCSDVLVMGGRQLILNNPKNTFYRDGKPINDASHLVEFNDDDEWRLTPAGTRLSAMDCGFKDLSDAMSSTSKASLVYAGMAIPGVVRIMGHNNDNFKNRQSFILWMSPEDKYAAPKNIIAYVSLNGTLGSYHAVSIVDKPKFSNVLAWPVGFANYDKNDSTDPGTLYLASFRNEDMGKEIYYQTLQSEWPIYRKMSIHIKNNAIQNVSFSEEYVVPPYACQKFVVGKSQTSVVDGEYTVNYFLGVS